MKKCGCPKCQVGRRKDRAVRAVKAARGDAGKLTVAYDWFRAELAVFAAHSGGDTKPAALLAENVWEAAEIVSKMNGEPGAADHER